MDKKYIPFLTVFLLLLSVACGLGTRQLDPMCIDIDAAECSGGRYCHGPRLE